MISVEAHAAHCRMESTILICFFYSACHKIEASSRSRPHTPTTRGNSYESKNIKMTNEYAAAAGESMMLVMLTLCLIYREAIFCE